MGQFRRMAHPLQLRRAIENASHGDVRLRRASSETCRPLHRNRDHMSIPEPDRSWLPRNRM